MEIEIFRKYMNVDYLMGPNSLRILEEIFNRYSVNFTPDDNVLDLGCGKGLTSFALAKETGAKIYANDLWVSSEENAERFEKWGVGEQIIPVHEDATKLSFDKKMFKALVSIDSYHYFAGEAGFFEDKILPFINDNGVVLIGIPGMKNEYTGRSEELLKAWLGEEAYMFKSCTQWREIIGNNERIETVETWEMNCFDIAWEEWFETEHEFALGDKKFYESLIKTYTCFVGIYIKLK